MQRRLLLLSNSTNYGEAYLLWPQRFIKSFLNSKVRKVLFIPYAGVTVSYDDYAAKVSEAFGQMGYEVQSIHTFENPAQAVDEAEAIAIGGGNTFRLLSLLYDHHLLAVIRRKVEGGTPFIGWSAGSNVAGPGIHTTNDMPIAEPQSFKALNIVPFQLNPHYTEVVVPGHNGETRPQRIAEFLALHPDKTVVGLPEGCLLRIEGENVQLQGGENVKIFRHGEETRQLGYNDKFNFLMQEYFMKEKALS